MNIFLKVFYLAVFVFGLFLSSSLVLAKDDTFNAGFVSGVWYSVTPFFDGDQVRIYSAIQNQSGFDIVGQVQFFDGQQLIGQSDFSAINGRLIEEWVDWQVTQGEHDIYAQIIGAKKSLPGQEPQDIELEFTSSEIDVRLVDFDTDQDNIGNQEDLDDDNDGLTDQEEQDLGTDPVEPDTDDDGISDKQEVDSGTNPLVAGGASLPGSPTQPLAEQAEKYLAEPTKQAVETIGKKAKQVINRLTEKLEEEKEQVEQEIEIGEELNKALEKFYQDEQALGDLQEGEPAQEDGFVWKYSYKWFLTVSIYVLNTWWLLLIVILMMIWFFWKVLRLIRR